MKKIIYRFMAFAAMVMACLVFSESIISENVSAEASLGVEYAYGDGYVYNSADYHSAYIYIYWSEAKGAESYNIYLYSPKTKKYDNVKNVSEKSYDTWSVTISDDSSDIDSYTVGGNCYFKIGAVRNGKETLSKRFSVKIDIYDSKSAAKGIAYRDDTVIYDFKLTDISGTGKTVNGSAAAKAEKLVKNSEYYVRAMTLFYNQKAYNSECAKLIDKKGNVVPKAEKQFIYDFDNDGKKESFILVSIPLENGLAKPYYVVVFRDSSGNMQVLDYCYSDGLKAELIDYGKFRHIHIGSYGGAGYQSWSSVYGVKNGKVKKYKSDRMSLYNYNGLMRIDSFMGGGGMFYYDLRLNEYIGVKGKPVTVSSVLALDKKNVINEHVTDSIKDNVKCDCYEWFGRYYVFVVEDRGDIFFIYEYKNGSLEECPNYTDDDNIFPRAFADSDSTKYFVYGVDPEDIQDYAA